MMKEMHRELRPRVECGENVSSVAEKLGEMEKKALEVATYIHRDDFRKTGEPYINHCIAVGATLRTWGADEEEVSAGFLHDTYEDHPDCMSLSEIEREFGERVAHLVAGVTKLKSYSEREEDFETRRKVARETLFEPGVAKIKLADRMNNMKTLGCFPERKQFEKARETLIFYVPLAESLGLWKVKNGLADASFPYVEPERYALVREKIDGDPRLEAEFISKTEEILTEVLRFGGVEAYVTHEVGGYYELAEKQRKSAIKSDSKPKDFGDITDVVSFRVIVGGESGEECYKAMGLVRKRFGKLLVKNRSDDYLVEPALNGYSALHDTYKLRQGNIEVAFTTAERERYNNWGVASIPTDEVRKNTEAYSRKLVFTPKNELVFLAPSARGIDVAYSLNPLLGLRAVAMKIDGAMYGLEEIVPNGAVVEIITDSTQKVPNINWLGVGNKETRGAINEQMIKAEHDAEVVRGELILRDGLLKERGILSLEDLDENMIDKLLLELGCWRGLEDLYYKVANGLDLKIVSEKLDELNVRKGMYTSCYIEGKNKIGVSEEVARVVTRCGGDVRSKKEKVDENEVFKIRILLTISYEGKKKIEEELGRLYPNSVVV